MAHVSIRDIRKSFGPVSIIKGVDIDIVGWRIRHSGRSLRMRKVDAAADDRRT